jgi:hypothetical protein
MSNLLAELDSSEYGDPEDHRPAHVRPPDAEAGDDGEDEERDFNP